MSDSFPEAEEVQRRLEILWYKLESEGHYVGANTVAQAQQLIKQLTGVDRPDLANTR